MNLVMWAKCQIWDSFLTVKPQLVGLGHKTVFAYRKNKNISGTVIMCELIWEFKSNS